MSCEIQGGYIIECRDSVGGIETIWLLEKLKVFPTAVDGTLTALSTTDSQPFWKFEVPRATASATNGITSSQENGTFFYTHEVSFPINSRNATMRNIVTTLAKNRCSFITKEGDGVYRLYGAEFGLTLDSSDAGSGVSLADRNGYMLKFSSQEREDFIVCPYGIIEDYL